MPATHQWAAVLRHRWSRCPRTFILKVIIMKRRKPLLNTIHTSIIFLYCSVLYFLWFFFVCFQLRFKAKTYKLLFLGSGAVGLGHFDKCSHEECLGGGHICSHEEGVIMLMTRVADLSLGYTEGRFELCVVGGFHDRRSVSDKVVVSLLSEL